MKTIKVGNLEVGNDKPFVLIAGLNVLEDDETIKDVIEECIRLTKKYNIPYIFKASYDKANRSSIDSYRGPGVEKGLKKLPRKVRNMAMRSALSSKLKDGNLLVLNDISFSSMKTKLLKESLNKLPLGKSALFVAGEEIDQNFTKALRNIPMHDVLPIQGANVYDILKRETLVLCKTSVEALVNRLTVSKVKTKIVKEKK